MGFDSANESPSMKPQIVPIGVFRPGVSSPYAGGRQGLPRNRLQAATTPNNLAIHDDGGNTVDSIPGRFVTKFVGGATLTKFINAFRNYGSNLAWRRWHKWPASIVVPRAAKRILRSASDAGSTVRR